METEGKDMTERLVGKSVEAFICAIELYNKPTIKYRVEGFAFFLCNAWELMLKAHLIKTKGDSSIYYKDNPTRTISLSDCIERVFTNDKDPLRLNLEKIVSLRNTSTHFITQEYELVYVPLFQAAVLNFCSKMKEFHGVDMADYIPPHFIQLSIAMKPLEADAIKAKYPEVVSSRLLKTADDISSMEKTVESSSFAIRIDYSIFITKKKEEATALVKVDNSSEDNRIKIVTKIQDPNLTHSLTRKKCVDLINEHLAQHGCNLVVNKYHFNLFKDAYDLHNNKVYCYINTINKNPTYSYSISTVDFIVSEIEKNPNGFVFALKKVIEDSKKDKKK
jgi:hypothetical protein